MSSADMTQRDCLRRLRIQGGSPVASYHQLYAQLRGCIEERRLLPGERLPSVVMLCGEVGLSRTTVVRALNELARDGLIVQRWGSGNYVADTVAETTELIIQSSPPISGYRTAFHAELLNGLEAGLGEERRRIWLSYVCGQVPSAREMLDAARARRVRSLAAYRPHGGFEEQLRAVADALPVVALLQSIPESRADAVVCDLARPLESMLRERLAAGRTSVFVAAPRMTQTENEESPYTNMLRVYRRVLGEALGQAASDATIIQAIPRSDNPELRARLAALPRGAVVVSQLLRLPGEPEDPSQVQQPPYEVIAYTESRLSLEKWRGRRSLLYLDMRRVGHAAGNAVLQREAAPAPSAGRMIPLEPERFEA